MSPWRLMMFGGLAVLLPEDGFGQVEEEMGPMLVVSHRSASLDYLYMGVPNPVHVAVAGVPCDSLNVSVSQGTVEGNGCSYRIMPDDKGRLLFLSAAWDDNGVGRVATREFMVRGLPLPQPFFAGRTCVDEDVRILQVRAGRGIVARYVDERPARMEMPIRFKVLSFDFELERECAAYFVEHAMDAALTDTMIDALKVALPGDLLWISNILVTSEQGGEMALPSIRLILRE